ncbi:MAG: hypothetical protein PUF51_03020 [Bifidobacteriaceae bacterium]|nr:hypothetical protein [Bifidobacteriaceae bacterium]
MPLSLILRAHFRLPEVATPDLQIGRGIDTNFEVKMSDDRKFKSRVRESSTIVGLVRAIRNPWKSRSLWESSAEGCPIETAEPKVPIDQIDWRTALNK